MHILYRDYGSIQTTLPPNELIEYFEAAGADFKAKNNSKKTPKAMFFLKMKKMKDSVETTASIKSLSDAIFKG